MKSRLPLLLLLHILPLGPVAAGPAAAQSAAPVPSLRPVAAMLQMNPDERQFFALGMSLSRGAFAYAELARQATAVSRTRSKIAQVRQLGRLGPTARRNRLAARDGLTQTVTLMQAMNAPAAALSVVQRAATRLSEPLKITADARPVGIFSGDAAQTISALSEFEALSSLPEDAALRNWLDAPAVPDSAQVWYGEGEIAALAEIADTQQMPELLPPAAQIATDMRGLRDWLSLRLPDAPSPEQTTLKRALESFLRDTASEEAPGRASRKLLTLPQLQALGAISRQLQAQVLGSSPAGRETASYSLKHFCSPYRS